MNIIVWYRGLLTGIKTHYTFLLLLVLSTILFLTNIGVYERFSRAESNFALGARMMVEAHEFLLPHAPHELPLNKPPLQYWLIGLSYKLFGFSHGASRIPSALCALGVITLVYVLGLRLRDKWLGVTASAILATSYIFWSFTRLAMPDMLLTLCVTAALACWILVLTERTERPSALARIGYGAVALGFLAKGPVAVALCLLPVLLASVMTRDVIALRRLRPFSGALVFLLLATPYFLLVYTQDGLEPLRNFFLNENMRRYTGTTYQTNEPFVLYELAAFFTDFAPWSPLLLVSAWSYSQWVDIDRATQRQLRLLLAWMIAPIVLFSLSRFKLDYYMLPGLPPAALLVAQSLFREGQGSRWARRIRLSTMVPLIILLAGALVVTIPIVEANFTDNRLRWLPHAVALLALLPAISSAMRGWTHRVLLFFSMSLWAAVVTSYFVLLPSYSRFLPPARLAASVPIASDVYSISRAGVWTWDLSMYLPTSQSVKPLSGDEVNRQLDRPFGADPVAVALIYERDYEELRKAGLQLRVLAQAEALNDPRLSLKSLFHPSRETLYLVTNSVGRGKNEARLLPETE